MMKRLFVLICLLAALVPLRAQTPSRLVQSGDLVHLGQFTIPDMQDAEALSYIGSKQYCVYTQGIIAFNPANQSLFLVCHNWTQTVAEISIPALGGQAVQLQGPRDPLEGHMGEINPTDPNSKNIGGMVVLGNQLVIAAYSYYDGSASAVASHFVRSTNLSATGTLKGPFRVGTMNPAFYAGAFAPVPAAWQGTFGPLLNGQCCLGIISRTSSGPSVSTVNPDDLLAAKNPTPATMLVGYPEGHATLASWSDTSPLFNGTTNIRGVLLIDGTASVLFVGRQGLGTFCYGTGAACNDPDDGSKGVHAYPYQPQVWAYNANDLAAVKAGTKQPWDVAPYATWKLPGLQGADVGGVALDPATGRIFVSENGVDNHKPIIHVYALSGAVTPPPVVPVDAVMSAWSAWTPGPWGACVNGTQTRTETSTRTVGTPAQNGGWSPTSSDLTRTQIGSQVCAVTPPPPVPTAIKVTSAVKTCAVSVLDTPPTTDAGWGVQFALDGVNLGAKKTASSGYAASKTVNAGVYQLTATWTKTGQTPVVRGPQPYRCE